MEALTECPLCSTERISLAIRCKDHTVSRETFNIFECESCGFWFTNPRPFESDLGKYYESEDYISHSNSRQGLFNKLYQKARNIALKRKRDLVEELAEEITADPKLLDYGCGTGEFLAYCEKAGWDCWGLEPSPKAREYGREKYGLKIFDTWESVNAQGTYSVITLWHVLEHISNLKERSRDLIKALCEGGCLVVAVPNRLSHDALIYKEHWAAYDVPRHLYHFREDDVVYLFEKLGLRHAQTLPMRMDSYYVSMLSEKYLRGGINPLRSMWNGWISNRNAERKKLGYSSQIYVFRKP
mgnify:CR=1 FL=1|jgi:SAM-dependent methyltransferase